MNSVVGAVPISVMKQWRGNIFSPLRYELRATVHNRLMQKENFKSVLRTNPQISGQISLTIKVILGLKCLQNLCVSRLSAAANRYISIYGLRKPSVFVQSQAANSAIVVIFGPICCLHFANERGLIPLTNPIVVFGCSLLRRLCGHKWSASANRYILVFIFNYLCH